ncbi:MAG: DUF4397 domain-containing protein [Chitinophagaceae bacterium]|nr:MAG: DUF4397 domain-containing protein [Chitinophagaceae bacterium]
MSARKLISLATVLIIGMVTSCKKEGATDNTPTLTFVNSVQEATPQDVFVNNIKANISALAYLSAASIAKPSGNIEVSFKNAGSATVSASGNVPTDNIASKTVFLVKEPDESLIVITYNNDRPATDGRARIRFIHVAPRLAASLRVSTTSGTSLYAGLAFKEGTSYLSIEAGTSLNVVMGNAALEVTTIPGTEFEPGKFYTVWFSSTTIDKANYRVIKEN